MSGDYPWQRRRWTREAEDEYRRNALLEGADAYRQFIEEKFYQRMGLRPRPRPVRKAITIARLTQIVKDFAAECEAAGIPLPSPDGDAPKLLEDKHPQYRIGRNKLRKCYQALELQGQGGRPKGT